MSSSRADRRRALRPDQDLLDEAGRRAGEILGVAEGVLRWQVADRLDRRTSTVFRLRAETPSGRSIGAYYKRSIPPPYQPERRQRWIDTVRAGLSRAMLLEARLTPRADEIGFDFSRALAVDPAGLSSVTLEVRGQPFGKSHLHLLGERRRRAVHLLERAGRAARAIEDCTEEPIEIDTAGRAAAIERRVERVRSSLPPAVIDRLENRMAELDRKATGHARSLIYAHGDLSPTNILVGERMGLIDFTWPAKVRGFDVAHLAFRLEYDTALPPTWTAHLTRALLEGYGVPDATEQAGWHLVRLTKLLKIVETGGRLGRSVGGRGRRARFEIETI